MRITLAATAALAFFVGAHPVIPPGPYRFDAKGDCHAATGMVIAPAFCRMAPQGCRDPKTRHVTKCPSGSHRP